MHIYIYIYIYIYWREVKDAAEDLKDAAEDPVYLNKASK